MAAVFPDVLVLLRIGIVLSFGVGSGCIWSVWRNIIAMEEGVCCWIKALDAWMDVSA